MKTSTKPMRGKKVSKELSEVLNRLAGEIPARKRAEVRGLLGNTDFADWFIRCTWWGGCYYCEDLDGKWHIVKCYA
jgi:hypothetical protein